MFVRDWQSFAAAYHWTNVGLPYFGNAFDPHTTAGDTLGTSPLIAFSNVERKNMQHK
jgi:hypothetical protein